MALRYSKATSARLLGWRSSDPTLFESAERELEKIKADPKRYGTDGDPLVERLKVFDVPGRDDQYAITWENGAAGDVFIADVFSVKEITMRSKLEGGH